jgi:hypothetical protein
MYSPVREYAVAAALAFMAGCCGRAYNVSGDMGLNLYIAVNGGTSTGKEGIKTAINKIIEELGSTVGSDGRLMTEGTAGFCPSAKGLRRSVAYRQRTGNREIPDRSSVRALHYRRMGT